MPMLQKVFNGNCQAGKDDHKQILLIRANFLYAENFEHVPFSGKKF
jgi:hypothetical protein